MKPTYQELVQLLKRYESAASDIIDSDVGQSGKALRAVWADSQPVLQTAAVGLDAKPDEKWAMQRAKQVLKDAEYDYGRGWSRLSAEQRRNYLESRVLALIL